MARASALSLPLLDRTMARAILAPMLLACVLFTVVFALFHLSRIAEVVVDVLPSFSDIVALLGAMVPQFLSLTFPLAFVFGVFVAYGDLCASGEYVALRSVGVSLHRAIRPAVVLGIVACAVGLFLAHEAEPYGKRRLKDMIREAAVDVLPARLRTGVFQQVGTGVLLYVSSHGARGDLEQVALIDERRPDKARAIFAERASVLRAGAPEGGAASAGYAGLRLVLRDGVIEDVAPRGDVFRRARFRLLELPLDFQSEVMRRTRFLREFEEWSTSELGRRAGELAARGENVAPLEVAWHRRFAVPFAALLMVLLGVPIVLAGGRGRRATSVILCVVLVGGYYFLLRAADGLAGKVPAVVAAWGPNALFALLAIPIYVRVARQ